ncbi:MAG: serine hydrolase domain-containing protein, partial [Bacteroidota bacterium]
MFRFQMILLSFFSLAVAIVGQNSPDPSQIAERTQLLLDQCMAAEDFVGVSVGIATADQVVWTDGAGYRNLAAKAAANADMLHRIASITKPMTAVAILQLVEKGHLDLDVPIQEYLPSFPKKKEGDITIRHLLTHTSGVPAYKSAKEFTTQVYYPRMKDALEVFQDRKLRFTPGEGFQYTTYGYTILGAIIEEVTGDTYQDYMKVNVWGPAGMIKTDIEETGKEYYNKARLYKREKWGAFDKDINDILSVKYAGGGLHSTAGDLLRFGQAILNGTLLSESSLELMQEIPPIDRGGNTPYGMGWYIRDDKKYGRILRHGGSQSGTSTYFSIYLDHDVITTVISNTANTGGEVYRLNDQIGQLLLDSNAFSQPVRTIVQLSEQELDRFVGTYLFSEDTEVKIIRREDQLWRIFKGSEPVRLYPISPTEIAARLLPW